jgi:nitrite reductase (cytochrome c-552)
LQADQIEDYYDSIKFTDWNHEETGAPMLKAQHPEFELWNQGVHARSGVSCADCHMPYKREGAVKISDHHIRSPLLNIDRACLTCHHFSAEEMKTRAEAIQDKTEMMLGKAKSAVGQLIGELKAAKALEPAALEGAKKLHRKAHWYLDFVLSENSYGFHAPQETARLLAEAIDAAHQGRITLLEAKAKK